MSLLEKRLENDLTEIRNRLADQAGTVEVAVNNALQALQTGNKTLAYQTVLNDYPINRNMRRIDRLCHRFIAVHLPSGAHLRLLSAAIRVNIELERIGDYAVTISREALQLSSPPTHALGRELDRIASETMLMLRQAIKSFNELNEELARSTKLMSGSMEYNLDTIYNEIAESSQVKDIKDTIALFVIFTQLKRVADQAKNLCEDAMFAASGSEKPPKEHNILFVDQDNALGSQLAEAIAANNHPDAGHYRSAGAAAADSLNPDLVSFMKERGVNMDNSTPTAFSDLTPHEIADQHVIVDLAGVLGSLLPEIPFHTSVLEWDIAAEGGQGDIDTMYRTLALNIKDLIDLMHGEES
jgi:phosphate transport system protein